MLFGTDFSSGLIHFLAGDLISRFPPKSQNECQFRINCAMKSEKEKRDLVQNLDELKKKKAFFSKEELTNEKNRYCSLEDIVDAAFSGFQIYEKEKKSTKNASFELKIEGNGVNLKIIMGNQRSSSDDYSSFIKRTRDDFVQTVPKGKSPVIKFIHCLRADEPYERLNATLEALELPKEETLQNDLFGFFSSHSAHEEIGGGQIKHKKETQKTQNPKRSFAAKTTMETKNTWTECSDPESSLILFGENPFKFASENPVPAPSKLPPRSLKNQEKPQSQKETANPHCLFIQSQNREKRKHIEAEKSNEILDKPVGNKKAETLTKLEGLVHQSQSKMENESHSETHPTSEDSIADKIAEALKPKDHYLCSETSFSSNFSRVHRNSSSFLKSAEIRSREHPNQSNSVPYSVIESMNSAIQDLVEKCSKQSRIIGEKDRRLCDFLRKLEESEAQIQRNFEEIDGLIERNSEMKEEIESLKRSKSQDAKSKETLLKMGQAVQNQMTEELKKRDELIYLLNQQLRLLEKSKGERNPKWELASSGTQTLSIKEIHSKEEKEKELNEKIKRQKEKIKRMKEEFKGRKNIKGTGDGGESNEEEVNRLKKELLKANEDKLASEKRTKELQNLLNEKEKEINRFKGNSEEQEEEIQCLETKIEEFVKTISELSQKNGSLRSEIKKKEASEKENKEAAQRYKRKYQEMKEKTTRQTCKMQMV